MLFKIRPILLLKHQNVVQSDLRYSAIEQQVIYTDFGPAAFPVGYNALRNPEHRGEFRTADILVHILVRAVVAIARTVVALSGFLPQRTANEPSEIGVVATESVQLYSGRIPIDKLTYHFHKYIIANFVGIRKQFNGSYESRRVAGRESRRGGIFGARRKGEGCGSGAF